MKKVGFLIGAIVLALHLSAALRAEAPGAFRWYQETKDSQGRIVLQPVSAGQTVRPMANGNVTLWLEAYDPDRLRRVSMTTPLPNTGTMTFIDGATRVYLRYGWKATAGSRTWTGSLRDALGNTYQTTLTLNVVL